MLYIRSLYDLHVSHNRMQFIFPKTFSKNRKFQLIKLEVEIEVISFFGLFNYYKLLFQILLQRASSLTLQGGNSTARWAINRHSVSTNVCVSLFWKQLRGVIVIQMFVIHIFQKTFHKCLKNAIILQQRWRKRVQMQTWHYEAAKTRHWLPVFFRTSKPITETGRTKCLKTASHFVDFS